MKKAPSSYHPSEEAEKGANDVWKHVNNLPTSKETLGLNESPSATERPYDPNVNFAFDQSVLPQEKIKKLKN